MVEAFGAAAEEIFQHQRQLLQGAGPQQKAAGALRGRTDSAARRGWDAGQTAARRPSGQSVGRIQGGRMGRCAGIAIF